MRNLYQTIVVIIVTFVVTLLLNTAVEYFSQDRGSILIGTPVTTPNQIYLPLSISNFANQPIDNLVLSVPVATTVSSIAASTAIQIEEIPSTIGTSIKKQIRLSGIEPRRVIQLLIPITNQSEATNINPVNVRQLGLSIEPTQGLQSSASAAFQKAVVPAIISVLFYTLFMLWLTSQSQKMQKELGTLRDELSKIKTESVHVKTVIIPKIQSDMRKHNLLLLSRLSEYARELGFWRDTIRKVIYQSVKDSNTAETLIRTVTGNLKTHSTLYQVPPSANFESLEILAGYINDNKKQE